MEERESFEGWAIIELFGHKVLAGRVSEQTIGGASFIRIDVPGPDAFTKFLGPSAIYAITPTTEEMATLAARNVETRPISVWVVPDPAPQLAAELDDWPGAHDEEEL